MQMIGIQQLGVFCKLRLTPVFTVLSIIKTDAYALWFLVCSVNSRNQKGISIKIPKVVKYLISIIYNLQFTKYI